VPETPTSTGPHGGSPSIQQPDYWWYRARSELLRTVLGPFVGTPQRLLDVGSADGPSVGWLDAPHKVSLDVDPRGLHAPSGVCGSLLALPFGDASFEVVTAFDVIEHCEPEDTALQELHRVLEPGGRLLVSVPAYQWAWTDHDVANGHHRRYTRPRAVAALERAGFEVRRATYGFTSVFPMFAAEWMLRRVRTGLGRHQAPGGPADVVDVPEVGAATERLLMRLCRLDERLLGSHDLPFGSSLFLAAVRT
jgi:SAM-dependent methyltransferase